MRILIIFSCLSSAIATLNGKRCGTKAPSNEVKALHAAYAKQDTIDRQKGGLIQRASYVINTYIHIITDSRWIVPDTAITKQIQTLNTQYAGSGISFTLAGSITRTSNVTWQKIASGTEKELEMKKALRQGTYKDLNLYFTQPLDTDGSTLLGFAYFPVKSPTADDEFLDGVVLGSYSVAGPPGQAPYDLGYTAVHEVGHWLGLFHTFGEANGANGCDAPGDYISDTPAEFEPAFGCDIGRDTCNGTFGSIAGVDPIHNFMDYSDDLCMNQFTAGQIKRASEFFRDYRDGK